MNTFHLPCERNTWLLLVNILDGVELIRGHWVAKAILTLNSVIGSWENTDHQLELFLSWEQHVYRLYRPYLFSRFILMCYYKQRDLVVKSLALHLCELFSNLPWKPFMGWVCWFSTLLRVFPRVFSFSSLSQNISNWVDLIWFLLSSVVCYNCWECDYWNDLKASLFSFVFI